MMLQISFISYDATKTVKIFYKLEISQSSGLSSGFIKKPILSISHFPLKPKYLKFGIFSSLWTIVSYIFIDLFAVEVCSAIFIKSLLITNFKFFLLIF